MIRTVPMVEDGSRFTVTIGFLLVDDSGLGIRKVSLIDNFDVELPVEQPSGCPPRFEFVTLPINRGRLPVFVESYDCSGQITPRDGTGPIFGSIREEGPGISMPCSAADCADNSECIQAVSDAVRSRNQVIDICSQCDSVRANISDLKNQRDVLIGIAIAAAAIGVVLVITGLAAGIGAFLLAVALILVIAAAVLQAEIQRKENNLLECEARLAASRDSLTEAQAIATAACCPGCIGQPIDMPC